MCGNGTLLIIMTVEHRRPVNVLFSFNDTLFYLIFSTYTYCIQFISYIV